MNPWVDPALFHAHLAIWFVLGAVVGSFLNVCIYRIPLGLSVNRPARSFCFACGSPVRWHDNIPLVSYWLLRGRCRDCGAPFSARYVVIELLTALLFAAVFARFGYSFALVTGVIFVSLLIVSMFTDLDHWIIPDTMSVGGALAGFALMALSPLLGRWGVACVGCAGGLPRESSQLALGLGPAPAGAWWGPAANSAFGAAFGYGLLWLVGAFGRLAFRKDAMGMGDLKLFACIGAFLGWAGCLLVLAVASFVGSAAGGAAIVAGRWRQFKRVRATAEQELSELRGSSDISNRSDGCAVEGGAVQAEAACYDLEADIAASVEGAGVHHLPFGPSIAVAALVVLFLQPQILERLSGLVTWDDIRRMAQNGF